MKRQSTAATAGTVETEVRETVRGMAARSAARAAAGLASTSDGDGDGDASEDDAYEAEMREGKLKGMTQQWTVREDKELLQLIDKYGAKRWSYIASLMRHRRGKQCRDRYLNHLRPGIKTGEWSKEEELILVEGHKVLGTKWAALAKLLTGRPENAIKNHWHATLRCKWGKVKSEPWKLTELQKYQMTLHPRPKALVEAEMEEAEEKVVAAKQDGAAKSAPAKKTSKTEDASGKQRGVSRSALNSQFRLIREEREKIEQGLKHMHEHMDNHVALSAQLKQFGTEKIVNEVNLSDDATTHSEDATTTRAEATGLLPGKSRAVKSEVATTTLEFDKLPRSSTTTTASKTCVDFIQISESAIDIAQCQAAVAAAGAPEVSMLTSVAAETGTSELAPNSSITVEEITMALETIAGVARATWRLSRVAIAARVGAVAKGDIKLCVAVGGHEWRDIITAAEFTISSIKSNATFLKSALELMRAAVARREGST